MASPDETDQIRTSALQTATSILKSRQQADQETRRTNEILRQRSRELAEALAIMDATLEATSEAIVVADDHGKVTRFNHTFEQMWGVPRAAMEGGDLREIWELMSRSFADPEGFLAIARDLPPESAETAEVLELADRRIVESTSKPLFIEGRSLGRVWSFRDVTERQAAEITARRLAAIVASSNDAIVGKDLTSTVTSWNDGAERIFGYTAEEMIGSSIMRLIPPERHAEEREILSRIRRGERMDHFETVRVRKDGRPIEVSITVSPIKDAAGHVIGASKIARDITEEKKSETALKQAIEAAEAANRERLQLLESERRARSEAERASRMKDEFLATLSHELRTPLNAVLGWANILRHETVESDELKQGIETIDRNARAQAQIIEDLLDMSRIISGKIRLEVRPTDLAKVVGESLETVRAGAQAKGVDLQCAVDPATGPISGDPNRLQQILWNLLNNAIKFTPRGGGVRVTVQRVGSHVELTVHDTGEGIAAEFLPYVFDRFQQADASITRRHGGLGLGLAIVKQLVELHGGTIGVESAGRGRGTTFTVRLPVLAVYASALPQNGRSIRTTESKPLPVASLASLDVLVVDDEPDARILVQRLLAIAGAKVRMAGSAAEAWECLTRQRPDVLICDVGMPEEDGYTFIRRVRESERGTHKRMPAVALTAYARPEDRAKALNSGFTEHLTKPVEPAELLSVVGLLQQPQP